MKKKFVTGHRVFLAVLAVLCPFVLIWQAGCTVQASAYGQEEAYGQETAYGQEEAYEQETAYGQEIYEQASEKGVREENLIPEKRLMKIIPLDKDAVTQIPRYIVEDDVSYVLDESSIVVEETGRSSSEGADVVTTSRKVEALPDNDLERIEKTITHEGISCDLLYVVYEITEEDEDGIPAEYSALCEYGGLKNYSRSYASAWQASVCYDAYEIWEGIISEHAYYEYAGNTAAGKTRIVPGENKEDEMEDKTIPEPDVKKYVLKKIAPGDEEEGKRPVGDFLLPLAAGVLGAGMCIPFLIWAFILTVPLFALKEGEKYRYIGQVRLKKEETAYAVYLTKRLIEKADLPVFKVIVPKKVWKNTAAGMMYIHCPDGRRTASICGKEVRFTLERE